MLCDYIQRKWIAFVDGRMLLNRMHRLEEFGARYLAERLELFLGEDEELAQEFESLIRESADRIINREETDTIELIDDIRYYLNERFRMRLDDLGADEMYNDENSSGAT